MISTDELFADDFKPEWLERQERLTKESFVFAVTATVDLRWQQEAVASAKRISDKFPPKKPLPALPGKILTK